MRRAAVEGGVRQHAKAPGRPHDPVNGSLSGHRVRIAGLKGRPELNGRRGVAAYFDAAKGRYAVTVEGEAEAVLLKPANLQEVLESDPSAVTLTLKLALTLALALALALALTSTLTLCVTVTLTLSLSLSLFLTHPG